ncbi:glycosyltransferase [Nocardia lasii]|uniref:Glycosyltransferase n=1 Tax=Nocardia lasii TaxID=1616107 RepID=A0ABW1JLD2_9NOCA
MANYLFVTWDGAGNLVPTLGAVRALTARGHRVSVLGHASIAERVEAVGARFVALSQDDGWDEMADPADFEAEIRLMIESLCFSPLIADDLAACLRRETPDAIVVDCLLFTALDVALASGIPTTSLFHTAYTILRGGPLVEMFAPGIALVNAGRATLGLPAIERLSDIHDACASAIVAVPSEFEPEIPDAANVVRIGPVLDAPPLSTTVDAVELAGDLPLVLISLSTSEQGQADLLTRCVDAVAELPVRAIVTTGPSIDPDTIAAGANTQVVHYAPHAGILPSAALVITHAGLGTTLAALGHGVPMVCVPMGRDQFFNAQRVQELGAGTMLPPDASTELIAAAARTLLADESAHATATRLATAIAGYPGANGAADVLESLTARTELAPTS